MKNQADPSGGFTHDLRSASFWYFCINAVTVLEKYPAKTGFTSQGTNIMRWSDSQKVLDLRQIYEENKHGKNPLDITNIIQQE